MHSENSLTCYAAVQQYPIGQGNSRPEVKKQTKGLIVGWDRWVMTVMVGGGGDGGGKRTLEPGGA